MVGIVALLLLAALTGCGPETEMPDAIPGGTGNDTNNGEATNNGTNATTGSSNNGTTGTDSMCASVECEPGRKCVKGVCVLETLKVACEDAVDLGLVELDAPLTVSGDTVGWSDSQDLACAQMDQFSGAENAFHLTVAAAARVDIELNSTAGIDWVMEVREGDCDDVTTALLCQDAEQLSFVAEPGKDYWILVEPRVGIDEGAFELTLEFTEQACSPPGGRTCDGDDVLLCLAGTSTTRFACGTGCSADACTGDGCATPQVVTASTSFAGDTDAFTDTMNFENQPTCSGSGAQGLQTPGPDVVLLLEGMVAGEVVTIDTSMNDDNDNAILVQQTCGATNTCLAGNDIGEKLEFTVPADGDYYVIIDKLSASAKTFFYSVDIP